MSFVHQTVLLAEAVKLLRPGVGKVMVDGTLGAGGHSEALLAAGARVIGVDRDPRALAQALERLKPFASRFVAAEGNYADLPEILEERGVSQVDGVLIDLGISSVQLDDASRGFSFQAEGPLDMRLEPRGRTAADLIATEAESSLAHLLKTFGEEPFARPIARELKRALPKSTTAAVEAVKKAVPRRAWPRRIHVATRTFQALRIAVNAELAALERLISALPRILRKNGVAAAIAFHSLEDRIVKQAFRQLEGRCRCPPDLPVCGCGASGDFGPLTSKAIQASDAEIDRNPRARSARLRAIEKLR